MLKIKNNLTRIIFLVVVSIFVSSCEGIVEEKGNEDIYGLFSSKIKFDTSGEINLRSDVGED